MTQADFFPAPVAIPELVEVAGPSPAAVERLEGFLGRVSLWGVEVGGTSYWDLRGASGPVYGPAVLEVPLEGDLRGAALTCERAARAARAAEAQVKAMLAACGQGGGHG